MTPERWQEVKDLLAAALERPPQERSGYLDRICSEPALRREVESLLAAQDQGDGSFLERLATADGEPLKPGDKIGPYEILAHIGAGGMGVVYRARDSRLEREVAIKILAPGLLANDAARNRFRKEALALARLNHANIAAVYDVGEQGGADYLVMECVPGLSLAEKLKSGFLREKEISSLGSQIAAALEEAHEQGIIHRDLKPANVMVTTKGQAKVLDFGLAKLLRPSADVATTQSLAETQALVGTLPYMSPEQLQGEPVDARTDIHALGLVLYEMSSGSRLFQQESIPQLTDAILHQKPTSLRTINPKASAALEKIILRCLAKEREGRYASAGQVRSELDALQPQPIVSSWKATLRQPVIMGLLLAVLGVLGLFGYLSHVRQSRALWAEKVVLPKVSQLITSDQPFAALRLLRTAEPYAQPSPNLVRARDILKPSTVSIETMPAGARIYIRDYNDIQDNKDSPGWAFLGISPLKTSDIPLRTYFRIRVSKNGFDTSETVSTAGPGSSVHISLHALNTSPPGMVWVNGAEAADNATFPAPPMELRGYWIDRYEVTNREFKKFVDSGGYRKHEYWKEPFIRDRRALSWELATAQFRDATGRPGPSTWQFGTYLEGTADFPVAGVSWYEAAAYARFAGKSLPTVYHWYRAAGLGAHSDILRLSNFDGHGPAEVGSYSGLGPFGTYDMAGNVKEWVLNPAGDRRYILGGAWNEPPYLYSLPDARKPFDRTATFGFRCIKYDSALPAALTGPVAFASRDRRNDKPANDQAFQIYLRLHSYDKTDLKPAIESVDDNSPYWRMEKVTFRAGYGDERVIARLYLPRGAVAPYQAVVYFPGVDAFTARSPEELQDDPFEFVVRSGRALMFPSYKGMLERGPGAYYHLLGRPNEWAEMNLQWSKDLGRSLDYLQTRPEIDSRKIAFCGFSLGAAMAPRLIAVEPRFKAAVLLSGGSFEKVPAEVDSWNFAPHVRIPVLMLNGRDDFRFPLESSQIPLFRLLGTPEKDKRHLLFDGGHVNLVTRPELIKDILDWLDQYLGPVSSQAQ
jgi:eukaryotic-like serine/threonine-protein kinase